MNDPFLCTASTTCQEKKREGSTIVRSIVRALTKTLVFERDGTTNLLPPRNLLVAPDARHVVISTRARGDDCRLSDGEGSGGARALFIVFYGELAGDVLRVSAET